MVKTIKKSIKSSGAMLLQESEVSSTTSDTVDAPAAAPIVPNRLRESLRNKIAKKALERSPKKNATAVKKAAPAKKRVRFQLPNNRAEEPAAVAPTLRRSSRIIARKRLAVENSSETDTAVNATLASDQPSNPAPKKSSIKKVANNSAIKKRSKETPGPSSSSAPRCRNQRVSKASGSRAKSTAAAKKKKRDTATQANTSVRDGANVTDANAAQLQNVEVADRANLVEAEERIITPPPQIEWQGAVNEVAQVVRVVGNDEVDDFADLPDLIPFDHDDVVVIEPLPTLVEEPLEIVFSGIPEVPAKRWITPTTEAGNKVIEYYKLEYGEGEMPEATTVEEAVDCIEMITRIELTNQNDQHVHDVVHGLKQLGLPYCPLFFYNKLVRKWVREQREYMKLRNYKMRRMARHVNKGSHHTTRFLDIKKMFKRTDISKFRTAAFRQTVQYLAGELETSGTLPKVESELEAFECIMFMLHREYQDNSGRTAVAFLNQFVPHPKSTWVKLYSALRPLTILKEEFQSHQFNQTKNTNVYFGKKKYQVALCEARTMAGLSPKNGCGEYSDDEDVDTVDHIEERDRLERKLGQFRAKHNLPLGNLFNRILP